MSTLLLLQCLDNGVRYAVRTDARCDKVHEWTVRNTIKHRRVLQLSRCHQRCADVGCFVNTVELVPQRLVQTDKRVFEAV